MKLFSFRKKRKKPVRGLSADEKRLQLEAMISAAASIQNSTFNGQARRFLASRHGRGVRVFARTLYYEADGLWLTALKLARELADQKRELEVLYLWGRLQHSPPTRSVLILNPASPAELVDIMRSESARGETEEAESGPPPVEPIPQLALRFYEEALPLAVDLKDTVKEIALCLFMTQVLRDMGKSEDAVRTREELQSRLERASASGFVLPAWLRDELGHEFQN